VGIRNLQSLTAVSQKAARLIPAAFFFSLALASGQAQAIFTDDEARKAILDLMSRVESLSARVANLERQLSQGQFELLNEIERQKNELSKIRGQMEEINQAVNVAGRQQKELFTNLDKRLAVVEPVKINIDGKEFMVLPREKQKFEAARGHLVSSDFENAAKAYTDFTQQYPASSLAPFALFEKGSAYYVMKDYPTAILLRQEFVDKYPTHALAPEALLNLSANQSELGNTAAARNALETLLANYPKSSLRADAAERLKDLPKPDNAGATKSTAKTAAKPAAPKTPAAPKPATADKPTSPAKQAPGNKAAAIAPSESSQPTPVKVTTTK
jgi:tol-pal system protein YbgF